MIDVSYYESDDCKKWLATFCNLDLASVFVEALVDKGYDSKKIVYEFYKLK